MIDIVLQYCVYNDYPIWRKMIKKYRPLFNKIILYPSRHHGYIDLEEFSKEQIKETWVDPVEIDFGKEDWRQAETIPCLEHVEADWIWFAEQDFFVDDWDKFFMDVQAQMEEADMIGWWSPSQFPYVHPSCLFIKKETLEKTRKDFRAHPDIIGCDHFAMLTRDVEKFGKIVKLQDLGYKNWENACHLGGMTYPYQNWSTDRHFGVGNVPMFYAYNHWSRKVEPSSPEYIKLSLEVEEELKKREDCQFDPEDNKFVKFFDI